MNNRPEAIKNDEYRYDSFFNGKVLLNKKKNHLPAMGWNSWNAFGSANTEALSKAMADKIVELELDKLGYKYVVLDDGCYKPIRIDGKVSNEEVKFPSGFKALGEYIHNKGLKFGMYNDIGTNLCAGANVGTYSHEETDAKSYVEWGIDFIKVDNCYYLWDNATFSDAKNARFVYAPNIKSIKVFTEDSGREYKAVNEGVIIGNGPFIENDYVTGIGTFDGTGPDVSPTGTESGELVFDIESDREEERKLVVVYAASEEPGQGSWLQIAVNDELIFDDFLDATEDKSSFKESGEFTVKLKSGSNRIRLMNHRRQENTLNSYAALLEGLNKAYPEHDIILSICEWGKTQPKDWGYKVGDSWRILNDITFRVGSENDPGHGDWKSDYTTSVTSQYNKAVIMDEYAGLNRGWNDPDMLMIGMEGLSEEMEKTHMAMWCMMNSPLMMGLDLRRVKKGDYIYKIIANKDLIDINQDSLGIQAKRIYSSLAKAEPDKEYIRDINRIDILAKPLSDNSIALSFINVSEEDMSEKITVSLELIEKYLKDKMPDKDFFNAKTYKVNDLWSKEEYTVTDNTFAVAGMKACGNVTLKVSVNE